MQKCVAKAYKYHICFLFIKSPEDLIKYAVGIVTLNLISNLMMWLYIPGYIVKVDKSQIRPFRDIKVILSLFIPTIAIQIYTIFDKTMLGLFTESSYENGYYEQAMKVVRMLQLIVTSIATVMAPRIGYYFARSEDDKIREYMIKAYRFVWFIGIPIALGMIGISDNMVPWFFGTGYEKVKLLLKILPVLTIIIGVSNVTGIQYLLPTQRQKILTKTVVAGAIVNFVANLFLIPRLYSVGAAVASVMAEIVISALQLWHIKEELNISGIFGTGKNYLVAGIMMLLILRIESSCLSASLVHTIIMIATGVAVYLGFLIMMRDEDIMNYLRKIKTIISVKYRGK
ncbi:membrane protein involved in the export of O-antigen and teichoic acid [Lachnospiraceae bacterium JC7]|nr:membrane protein involved in the export of O-antigen and teichoic acid [Lachnospiraceae bacterium JC7]